MTDSYIIAGPKLTIQRLTSSTSNEQHKQLFLLGEVVVKSLINSGDQKLAAAQLQAFIVLAQGNFKYQEVLMRSAGYPDSERHAKYHASLLTELIGHCDRMHWGRNGDRVGLSNFLWNWLILHIDLADREVVV
ncbi:MAG: hypothetical protein A3H35_05545 [Betaproteobacteria bacterium RIFCSPLOWO2_02_FULL_62_17]|nr:MAG: hypothetical protein A3H35_05545 [Betaproteobacteria bacterium RIFCSPLOWO2_02_FULL_62_17]